MWASSVRVLTPAGIMGRPPRTVTDRSPAKRTRAPPPSGTSTMRKKDALKIAGQAGTERPARLCDASHRRPHHAGRGVGQTSSMAFGARRSAPVRVGGGTDRRLVCLTSAGGQYRRQPVPEEAKTASTGPSSRPCEHKFRLRSGRACSVSREGLASGRSTSLITPQRLMNRPSDVLSHISRNLD